MSVMSVTDLTKRFDAQFRSFSEQTKAEMRALYPVLEPHVEKMLVGAYTREGFTDQALLERTLKLQRTHYNKILTCQFDETYVDVAMQLHAIHAGLGITADMYISSYAYGIALFAKPLAATMRRKPERIGDAMGSLAQCMLLDLNVAMALHVDDVEARAEADRLALASSLESQVKGVITDLTRSGTDLRDAAKLLTGTADETSRQATQVAATASQASANVQTVASAAEKLSSAIGEIARQVSQSSTIARKAADEARKTDVTVAGLSSAAAKIGEIVKLIATIAGQTNLLALNATIEAARAGEAGKGFAVVAQEVKNLATQTAKATEDITGQVGAIQTATNETVTVMRGIGNTITEINEIAATIATAVEEQGSATAEIARNVQEAASGTGAVSRTIEQVTRSAEQTGTEAERVLQTSQSLNGQSTRLEAAVTSFVASIRKSA